MKRVIVELTVPEKALELLYKEDGTVTLTKVIPRPNFPEIIQGLRTPAHSIVAFDTVTLIESMYDEDFIAKQLRSESDFLKEMVTVATLRESRDNWQDASEQDREIICAMVRCKLLYGFYNDADYMITTTGTHTDAIDSMPPRLQMDGGYVVRFETLVNPPHEVAKRLSEAFPNDEIWIQWASETIGRSVGITQFINGKCEFIRGVSQLPHIPLVYGTIIAESEETQLQSWVAFARSIWDYPDGRLTTLSEKEPQKENSL